MYGKNPVTKQFLREDGALAVHSIWPTIQGEGPQAGWPAVFVRLQGCPLRCWFCDTEFDTGELQHPGRVATDVIQMAFTNKIHLVVITGGDPIIQNFIPLVEACNNADLSVSVETAGTHWVPGISTRFHPENPWGNLIVCSPKTGLVNSDLIPYVGAWKYLIRDGEVSSHDGLPHYSTQSEGVATPIFRPPPGNTAPIYLQPVDEGDRPDGHPTWQTNRNTDLARDLCLKYGYRLSLQLHKLVGVP